MMADNASKKIPVPSEAIKSKYNIINEGSASILFPLRNEVFYNPVQEFNRDLSIAVIKAYQSVRASELAERQAARNAKSLSSQPQLKASTPTSTLSESNNSHAAADEADVDHTHNPSGIAHNQTEDLSDEVAMDITDHHGYKDASKVHEQEDRQQNLSDTRPMLILEALSATGLRSIRYAKEIPGPIHIIANDLSSEAVESIQRNIEYNGVESAITPNLGDATVYMISSKNKRFDVIDLDPYGSAAPFIDASMQAISHGGLLCVTCTDSAVLCGAYPETSFAKYGSISLKGDFAHESALRVLLFSLSSHASRHGRYIVPLLSLSIDFYVRVFIRVYESKSETKRAPFKNSMVYECSGCGNLSFQPLGRENLSGKSPKFSVSAGPPVARQCVYCSFTHHIAGPIWTNPIHDRKFLNNLLSSIEGKEGMFKTHARIKGMVTTASEEIPEIPLFRTSQWLNRVFHSPAIKQSEICSAILNGGYKVSSSHCEPTALKTDAPWDFLLDIWRERHKVTPFNIPGPNHVVAKLLMTPTKHNINFTRHAQAKPNSKEKGIVRYQENPLPNWGPKSRASQKRLSEEDSDDLVEHEAKILDKKDLLGVRQGQPKKRVHSANQKQFVCKKILNKQVCPYEEDTCRYSHDLSKFDDKGKPLFLTE